MCEKIHNYHDKEYLPHEFITHFGLKKEHTLNKNAKTVINNTDGAYHKYGIFP